MHCPLTASVLRTDNSMWTDISWDLASPLLTLTMDGSYSHSSLSRCVMIKTWDSTWAWVDLFSLSRGAHLQLLDIMHGRTYMLQYCLEYWCVATTHRPRIISPSWEAIARHRKNLIPHPDHFHPIRILLSTRSPVQSFFQRIPTALRHNPKKGRKGKRWCCYPLTVRMELRRRGLDLHG